MYEKFYPNDEVYSRRLHKFLTIDWLKGDYAYCYDVDGNSVVVHVSDLQPAKWDAEDILGRKG